MRNRFIGGDRSIIHAPHLGEPRTAKTSLAKEADLAFLSPAPSLITSKPLKAESPD